MISVGYMLQRKEASKIQAAERIGELPAVGVIVMISASIDVQHGDAACHEVLQPIVHLRFRRQEVAQTANATSSILRRFLCDLRSQPFRALAKALEGPAKHWANVLLSAHER